MTYHAYTGLGAHIVEHTLKSIIRSNHKKDVSEAIISSMRHLRHVVGLTMGERGLRRFDSDVLFFFNKYKSAPEKLNLELCLESSPMSLSSDPERIKAILKDTVDNCLLLNAKGMWTSTDVLIDMFISYLIALNGQEASLGDMLLDVNNYRVTPTDAIAPQQKLSLH